MPLPISEVGSPYRKLSTKQKARKADNTYTAIASFGKALETGFAEVKKSREADMERQARNDLVNESVNADLVLHEESYAKVATKGSAKRQYIDMKTRLESGEFDTMSPEDFQATLNGMHEEALEQYTSAKHYSAISDEYNKFWVDNEMTLTANQSARHRVQFKKEQTRAMVDDAVMTSKLPGATYNEIRDVIYDPDYSLMDAEDRQMVAFETAILASKDGNYKLLEQFDNDFSFSTDPKTADQFDAAMKTSQRAANTLQDKAVYDIILWADTKEDKGTLTDADYLRVVGKVDKSGNAIYTQKQFRSKVNKAKVNRAKNVKRAEDRMFFTSGIDLTGSTPKEFTEIAKSTFIQAVQKYNGDTLTAMEDMGRYLGRQSNEYSEFKDRYSMFNRYPLLVDNEPNPDARQRFNEIEAFERGMLDTVGGKQAFANYMGDSLADYLAIKNAMNLTQAGPDEAWAAAAESIQLQRMHAGEKKITSNLSAKAKTAAPDIAERVFQRTRHPWIPDSIEKVYETDDPAQRIATVAAQAYDASAAKGFSDEVNREYAERVADQQISRWAGEAFDTRGVPMTTLLGTNDPEGAWKTVLNDPIYRTHLEEMFGTYIGGFFTPEPDKVKDPNTGEMRAPITAEEQREVAKRLEGVDVVLDPTNVVKSIDMDKGTLEFRSPRDGGIYYSIPLRDIGALHELKKQDPDGIKDLDRFYSSDYLSTIEGKRWANKQADLNDRFLTTIAPTTDIDPQEYVGMPQIEQTRIRKQYYADNYTGIMGRARQIRDYFTLKAVVDKDQFKPLPKSREMAQAERDMEAITAQNIAAGNPTVLIQADGPGKRNNNPGNLRASSLATGKKDGFSVFATPEEGFKALIRQVDLDADRGDTLKTFIRDFAPSTENDTGNYLNFLVKRLGVPASTKLSDLDSTEVAKAVAFMESNTIIK